PPRRPLTHPTLLPPLHSPPHHRGLHSLPTRRSSDLRRASVRVSSPATPTGRQSTTSTSGTKVLIALRITRARSRPSCPTCSSWIDRKSTRLNSSHGSISYAVFCLKKKKKTLTKIQQT